MLNHGQDKTHKIMAIKIFIIHFGGLIKIWKIVVISIFLIDENHDSYIEVKEIFTNNYSSEN